MTEVSKIKDIKTEAIKLETIKTELTRIGVVKTKITKTIKAKFQDMRSSIEDKLKAILVITTMRALTKMHSKVNFVNSYPL